jgi:hypothetical protein
MTIIAKGDSRRQRHWNCHITKKRRRNGGAVNGPLLYKALRDRADPAYCESLAVFNRFVCLYARMATSILRA